MNKRKKQDRKTAFSHQIILPIIIPYHQTLNNPNQSTKEANPSPKQSLPPLIQTHPSSFPTQPLPNFLLQTLSKTIKFSVNTKPNVPLIYLSSSPTLKTSSTSSTALIYVPVTRFLNLWSTSLINWTKSRHRSRNWGRWATIWGSFYFIGRYSLVNVFGTRIRELQTTIINQVGQALIASFEERL